MKSRKGELDADIERLLHEDKVCEKGCRPPSPLAIESRGELHMISNNSFGPITLISRFCLEQECNCGWAYNWNSTQVRLTVVPTQNPAQSSAQPRSISGNASLHTSGCKDPNTRDIRACLDSHPVVLLILLNLLYRY